MTDKFITSINKIYNDKSEVIEIFKGIDSNINLIKWLKSTLKGIDLFCFSFFYYFLKLFCFYFTIDKNNNQQYKNTSLYYKGCEVFPSSQVASKNKGTSSKMTKFIFAFN